MGVRTNVYVDGFNLYYGCLRDSPWKWLDVPALCRALLPKNTINHVWYFTARIQARPGADPQQPLRQMIYLRALETCPGLKVHLGQFLSHTKRMALAKPLPKGPRFVDVVHTEEKGSDVNLATRLLMDAVRKDFDLAVVVSNDSDLVYPIHVVRKELGFKVGVVAPILDPDPRPGHAGAPRSPSYELRRAASFFKTIDHNMLAACQFPNQLNDTHGTITRPAGW